MIHPGLLWGFVIALALLFLFQFVAAAQEEGRHPHIGIDRIGIGSFQFVDVMIFNCAS